MTRAFWCGLDIGVETTSVCVIDDRGEVLQQTACATTLDEIHNEIRWLRRRRHARVGLEAGAPSFVPRGLRSLGYSVDVFEARRLSKFLKVRRNKTDKGDALGIAEAGRVGATILSKVHLKSFACQCLHSRLAIRRSLIRERVANVNLLCRQLELFGGRVTRATTPLVLREKVATEIKRLFGSAANPVASELRQLLERCEELFRQEQRIERGLKILASENEVCRRFMEIPGVGPICALTFYAAVDEPSRFKRCTDVGAYLGLVPRIHESGMTRRGGRISKMGNTSARTLLVQASLSFVRWSSSEDKLRSWASQVEQRRGCGRARVALARKLAVVMLAMWKSGDRYCLEHDSTLPILGPEPSGAVGMSCSGRSSLALLRPDELPQAGTCACLPVYKGGPHLTWPSAS